MKKLVLLLVLLLVFAGCNITPRKYICGVPVEGSPWQLAASVADYGDGTFIPECVLLAKEDEALIEGWNAVNTDHEYQAFIHCKLRNNIVVEATIKTTLADDYDE